MSANQGLKPKFNLILCPVDLSTNSLPAIELATIMARHHGAKVNFMFVATQWVSDDALLDSDYVRGLVEQDREAFLKVRPTDLKVDFTHTYVRGNPGPEIVIASRSCDTIVMTTRGQSAFMRFLMGGVSQYVLRHADCPVILLKCSAVQSPLRGDQGSEHTYVTCVMQHVSPIQGFEKMEDVLAELEKASQTAAPVISLGGECVGILTKTDIARYHQLLQRYLERDKSVVDEIFEIDKYGHRRVGNHDFDQVKRHMTSPVVTVANSATVQAAKELFAAHPTIHHLVVIDEANHPIGILDATVTDRIDRSSHPENPNVTQASGHAD